jgi:hypothetical protein
MESGFLHEEMANLVVYVERLCSLIEYMLHIMMKTNYQGWGMVEPQGASPLPPFL